MLALVLTLVLSVAPTPPSTRAAFTKAAASVKPGMTQAEVIARLGAPDDVVTEGISAARTASILRWGTDGHGTFATLGAVHLMANGRVQYVYGGEGTPIDMPEGELRPLLRTLARVPSYNRLLRPRVLTRR